MTTALILISLFTLLLMRVPVAFALGGLGLVLLIVGGFSPLMAPQGMLGTIDNFVLLAVPLFLLMSNVLLKGGVGRDLFAAVQAWVGHLPGGLAIATVISCGIFAAISGSSVATAATIGTVAIPEMSKRGYPRHFVLGLLAAGGTLGILIPPSIPMIVYGFITEESVIALFKAGIGPGLMLMALFIGFSMIYAHAVADLQAIAQGELGRALALWLRALPALALAALIIWGDLLGRVHADRGCRHRLCRLAGDHGCGAAHADLEGLQGGSGAVDGDHGDHPADRGRGQGVRQGDLAVPHSAGRLDVHLAELLRSLDVHPGCRAGAGADGAVPRSAVDDADHGAGAGCRR
jgi:hypothetical protein